MTPEAPLTIVLVDDAEDCLSMLELALHGMPGVETRSARNAEEALELLAGGRVSAVITDLQLPGMTGIDLISRIRLQPGLEGLPVIVISAAADPAAPRQALACGANAFFAKPFSPAAVRRKLEELIHA